jgi:hypothetical protein
MDMVIYKLNAIIKGLRTIKDEMEDEGLIDFRGVNVDALIAKARAAKLAIIDFIDNPEDEDLGDIE